jgi:TATA-binding protein-associated factor Taf7
MGVDYYVCDQCGDSAPDCSSVTCDRCSNYYCDRCATSALVGDDGQECVQYTKKKDHRKPTVEQVTGYVMRRAGFTLDKALQNLGITWENAVKEFIQQACDGDDQESEDDDDDDDDSDIEEGEEEEEEEEDQNSTTAIVKS